MKHSSLLYLILSAFIIFSCSKEKEAEIVAKPVSIKGTVTNATSSKVKISYSKSGLDRSPITLAEVELDSTGNFEASFELVEPVKAYVSIAPRYAQVFIEPGDELIVNVDAKEFVKSLVWEGKGAETQNYLAQKSRMSQNLLAAYKGRMQGMYQLELDEFEGKLESIKKAKDSLFTSFMDSAAVSEEFQVLEKAEILGEWAKTKIDYPLYHGYYTGKEDFEVPDSYYAFLETVPMEKSYLVSGAYKSYLESIVRKSFTDYTDAHPEDSSVNQTAGYISKNFEIASNIEAPSEIKDYLTAKNVYNYISFSGVDSLTDVLVSSYKNTSPAALHLGSIEEIYAKWAKLSKGQPAPNFTYLNLDSANVSLSDFVGKVVYIDVWATWCGPCLRELPSSKKLHEELGDREDLVFLYVSIDSDKAAWKKMLAEDDKFRTMGEHLIADKAWESQINEEYMIKGIPRYMLIGKDGKISDSSAPRPSSGEEIKGAIEKLLNEGAISSL